MNSAVRFLAICGLFVVATLSWAGDKPWIEVRSEHFRVISDGEAKEAMDIAREFEQMRAVFAAGASNMRLDSGVPLLVIAVRDANSMARVLSWPQTNSAILGLYQEGWEKQYAVVRLDEDRPGYYQPAFHEYVHSLLHSNFRWLPTWLDEGLAEFYGTTEFKQDSAIIGEPSQRKYVFDRQDLIPLKTLLGVGSSPHHHDGVNVTLFYAEAWGLTHYLIFGDGMEGGKKLVEFYTQLQAGVDQEKAFEQVFGSIDQVQDKLQKYVHKGKMHAWQFNNPPQILERNFAVRTLTPVETHAELAAYSIWGSHNIKTARHLLSLAVQDDSQSAAVHEDLAFADFAEGKDEDAVQEFRTTLEKDKDRYLSRYFETMLSPEAHSAAAADRARFESNLLTVLQVNPQFAQAYIQLALLYARQGDLKKATAVAIRAAQLQPSRAGYELLVGELLLQQGRLNDAASIAKYVADRWQGPDRDEAIELWSKVPQDQRAALRDSSVKTPEGVKQVEGVIRSSACSGEGADRKVAIVLNHNGEDSTFQTSKGFAAGFSDILWYDRDHFNVCHHIEGLRAIASYKAGDGHSSNELVELQLRVDVPIAPTPKTEPRQTTEK